MVKLRCSHVLGTQMQSHAREGAIIRFADGGDREHRDGTFAGR